MQRTILLIKCQIRALVFGRQAGRALAVKASDNIYGESTHTLNLALRHKPVVDRSIRNLLLANGKAPDLSVMSE